MTETVHGGPSPAETQTLNPDQNPEAQAAIRQDLAGKPFYRRAIGRVMHPILTIREVATSDLVRHPVTMVKDMHDKDTIDRTEAGIKEASWEAAQGRAGADLTGVTRDVGKFNPELAPMTRREWRRAHKMANRFAHENAENVTLFTLQQGPYSIDPETGKSKWRDENGDLPKGLSRKTRKLIEKDEEEFKHVEHAVVGREVALVGEEVDGTHGKVARSPEERKAAKLEADLAQARKDARTKLMDGLSDKMKALLTDAEIKKLVETDPEVLELVGEERRAAVKAGKKRADIYTDERTGKPTLGYMGRARVRRQAAVTRRLEEQRAAAEARIAQRRADITRKTERRKQEGRAPRRAVKAVRRKVNDKRAAFAHQQALNRRGVV